MYDENVWQDVENDNSVSIFEEEQEYNEYLDYLEECCGEQELPEDYNF